MLKSCLELAQIFIPGCSKLTPNLFKDLPQNSHLEELETSHTNIFSSSSSVEIAQWAPNLESVYLNDNKISPDELLEFSKNLPHLTNISLSDCSLFDEHIDAIVKGCFLLEYLNLSGNHITADSVVKLLLGLPYLAELLIPRCNQIQNITNKPSISPPII